MAVSQVPDKAVKAITQRCTHLARLVLDAAAPLILAAARSQGQEPTGAGTPAQAMMAGMVADHGSHLFDCTITDTPGGPMRISCDITDLPRDWDVTRHTVPSLSPEFRDTYHLHTYSGGMSSLFRGTTKVFTWSHSEPADPAATYALLEMAWKDGHAAGKGDDTPCQT